MKELGNVFFLAAGFLLLVVGCQTPSGKPPGPGVSGETSGTVSRLRLTPAEKSGVEAGGREFFRNNAGSPPPPSASGMQQGDVATSDLFLSDYQPSAEPRSMRGLTEDLVILPYNAKVSSVAGGAAYRSYLLATRPKGGGRWKYEDGFSIDPLALYRRFPGLKETNAVPPARLSMRGTHPALRKGA